MITAVEKAVAEAVAAENRLLLAVSGGRDSMVMLDVLARVARPLIAGVATFDHGTGPHAGAACQLAVQRCRDLGVEVTSARAEQQLRTEAELRHARWQFLREVAARSGARVATAHTQDDQLETVVIRILRGSGARGLAGLYADTGVSRPLLSLRRDQITAYARQRDLEWVDDPSNWSRLYLRNRVRLDLLPALLAVRPSLGAELLELAGRAAMLRREVDAHVAEDVPYLTKNGTLIVARDALVRYDSQGLALLWPSLAARAGVTLDRRGTVRLASFTMEGARGGRIQLSGGVEAVRHRERIILRRAHAALETEERPLTDDLIFGRWRFRQGRGPDGLWSAVLPADRSLRVRSWRPGDRMRPEGAAGERRIKGLFRDAGVEAGQRRGWPVVLAGDEIVWVPGVRRSRAAAARPGRPVVRFVCERLGD